MDLYIIRHAWAGQYGDPDWPDDSQRPLTKKGRKRFAAMIGILINRGIAPSLIATSPMVRCRESAQILAEGLIERTESHNRPELVEHRELLPHGDLNSLLDWTAQRAEKHRQIAWVGHAPDVGQITAALIGCSGGSIRFAKGAVAALRFDDSIEIGNADLRWLATAKIIGAKEDESEQNDCD
jgi:phosphohistidine phosphatase